MVSSPFTSKNGQQTVVRPVVQDSLPASQNDGLQDTPAQETSRPQIGYMKLTIRIPSDIPGLDYLDIDIRYPETREQATNKDVPVSQRTSDTRRAMLVAIRDAIVESVGSVQLARFLEVDQGIRPDGSTFQLTARANQMASGDGLQG